MKIKKKKKNSGTQVPCEVLEFMEIDFLEKIQVELEFQKKKNSKSTFTITRCYKNQVCWKIEFQNRSISLISFRQGVFCWKVCKKEVKARFGLDTTHEGAKTVKNSKHRMTL